MLGLRFRMLMWLLLTILAALISYIAFRSYLGVEFLINFANSFYC